MKAKRQKLKVAKARANSAKGVEELETKKGTESEPNGVAQPIEPPKKKPRLGRPPSLGKSMKQLDDDPQRRQPMSPKEPHTTDAKTNVETKPTDKRKKRKEVTNYLIPALTVVDHR